MSEPEENFWQLRYDKVNWCDLYLGALEQDASKIESMMVSRPCVDGRLWDGLAAILKLGNVVLHFPGGAAPLFARVEVVEHLPPEMVKALGQPVCVATGKEISDAIDRA